MGKGQEKAHVELGLIRVYTAHRRILIGRRNAKNVPRVLRSEYQDTAPNPHICCCQQMPTRLSMLRTVACQISIQLQLQRIYVEESNKAAPN